MLDFTPLSIPMENTDVTQITSEPLPDPTEFRAVVGFFQYLYFTRPDFAFSISSVGEYLHAPCLHHWQLVKRILLYLNGTLHYGQHLYTDSYFSLIAYSDSDGAGCKEIRRSTTGFCTFLGKNCISWSAKKQVSVVSP